MISSIHREDYSIVGTRGVPSGASPPKLEAWIRSPSQLLNLLWPHGVDDIVLEADCDDLLRSEVLWPSDLREDVARLESGFIFRGGSQLLGIVSKEDELSSFHLIAEKDSEVYQLSPVVRSSSRHCSTSSLRSGQPLRCEVQSHLLQGIGETSLRHPVPRADRTERACPQRCASPLDSAGSRSPAAPPRKLSYGRSFSEEAGSASPCHRRLPNNEACGKQAVHCREGGLSCSRRRLACRSRSRGDSGRDRGSLRLDPFAV